MGDDDTPIEMVSQRVSQLKKLMEHFSGTRGWTECKITGDGCDVHRVVGGAPDKADWMRLCTRVVELAAVGAMGPDEDTPQRVYSICGRAVALLVGKNQCDPDISPSNPLDLPTSGGGTPSRGSTCERGWRRCGDSPRGRR